jgi:hypothetical protein
MLDLYPKVVSPRVERILRKTPLADGNYFLYAFGVFSVIIIYRDEGKTSLNTRRLLNV